MTDELKRYKSPLGDEIIGVLEVVRGCANINGFYQDGSPQYAGGTTMYWDEQKPVVDEDGGMIYLDELGAEWKFSDLVEFQEETE